MITLFAAKGTISIAAALALEEAGVDYTLNLIRFADGDQKKPEYLAINPKGRVPALITGDVTITETGAILEYIGTVFPDAGLIPQTAAEKARMREMMFYLASTMHVNHAHKLRGSRWADRAESHEDMTAKVTQTMTESCTYVEDFIAGPFVLGDQISLADLYLYTVCTWLEGDGVAAADFPKIQLIRDRISQRGSVRAVTEKGLL